MKKPINEIERLKLIAGLINEIDYNESVHGVKTKTSLTEAKKATKKAPKELSIDQANPYEFRHGLQHELGVDSDYSDESLASAKAKVLKNLAKDANYYSTLLNQKQSPYEFKEPEVYAKGMQANADGTLKKGAGKLEKANVKDTQGKKEAGKLKPKGIKIMPDKGVTGTQKTIKEGAETDIENKIKSGEIDPKEIEAAAKKAMNGDSTDLALMMAGFGKMAENKSEEDQMANKYISVEIEDGEKYPMLNSQAISDYLKSVMDPEEVDSFMNDEEGFDESSMHFDIEDNTTEQEVEDWAKQEMNYYLYSDSDEFPDEELEEAKAKKYVVFDKARGEKASKAFDTKEEAEAELKKINAEDPEHGDYVIDIMEGVQPKEDKHTKIKEALKSALKKESIFKKPGSTGGVGSGGLVVASSPTSKSQLKSKGYTEVPGTSDVAGI